MLYLTEFKKGLAFIRSLSFSYLMIFGENACEPNVVSSLFHFFNPFSFSLSEDGYFRV